MVEPLLVVGVVVAVFVGVNIGGSSTGVAFGPAVDSGVLSKVADASLVLGFALLGGWTVGRGAQASPRIRRPSNWNRNR